MLSVDCEESESAQLESQEKDEFAEFVNASIHPPNELSVPRCYGDTIANAGLISPARSLSNAPYKRSRSLGSQSSSQKALNTLSPLLRPRLKRGQAQDIADEEDITPNINIELADSGDSLSLQGRWCHSHRSKPVCQRSAPGTPMHRGSYSSRSPSRADSDESGYLRVPLNRARGVSLPESMEESITKHNSYLLRQFNIKGKKVISLGDCYQRSGSLSSYGSGG